MISDEWLDRAQELAEDARNLGVQQESDRLILLVVAEIRRLRTEVEIERSKKDEANTMAGRAFAVIEVEFEWRDGYLHVTSKQVLGLHLCGPDSEAVLADVIPAIKTLFKLNHGLDVEVVPETELSLFPTPREKLDLPIARMQGRLVAYQHAAVQLLQQTPNSG